MTLNKVYNENCLDTLSMLGNKEVGLTITSPPYNMNLRIRNGKYLSRTVIEHEFSTKYVDFDDCMPMDEFHDLHLSILKELIRVSRTVFYNIQIVTGSKVAFFRIIGELSDCMKDIIIWDKEVSQPAMHKGVLNRQSELLLVFESPNTAISREFGYCNFDRGTMNDVWRIKRDNHKKDNYHGATFPEALIDRIIVNFSKPDDIIYDPYMGTGTTARVAILNKRQWLGSEVSKLYCDMIEKRVNDTIEEMRIKDSLFMF